MSIKKFSLEIPKQTIHACVFPFGSVDDPARKEGLAHIAEHMLLESKSPEGKRYKHLLEEKGVEVNASTFKDRTYFYHVSTEENSEYSRKLLLEHMNSIEFLEDSFHREKQVVLEEYEEHTGDVHYQIWNEGMKLLFPESRLSIPIIGTRKSIEAISASNVRGFLKEKLNISNGTFISVSNESVSIEGAQKSISDVTIQTSEEPCEPIKYLENKNSEVQSLVSIFFETVPVKDLKTRAVLRVLANYLANSWNSTLVKKLREEKGLVYWVGTDSDYFNHTGYFEIDFATETKNLTETQQIVFDELESIISGQVDEEILYTAKNIYHTQLTYIEGNPQKKLEWAAESMLYKMPFESVEDAIEGVRKVQNKDLQRVAEKCFKKEAAKIVIASAET